MGTILSAQALILRINSLIKRAYSNAAAGPYFVANLDIPSGVSFVCPPLRPVAPEQACRASKIAMLGAAVVELSVPARR